MDITISAKHVELDDDLRNFANAQVSKIAEEFENPKLNSCQVFFTAERNWQIVSLNVTGKNININAKAKEDSAKAAVANAVDKIIVQIRRYLDRVQDAAVKADPKLKERIWTSQDLANTEDEFDA